jgi:hypothetical protein
MKSIIAAGILLGCAQGAIAGPYANIEANSGYYGDEYTGSTIENHVGYEGDGWYIQGGPAILSSSGVEAELEWSGKVGAAVAVNETLDLYGEISYMTGDEESNYNTKVGVKWAF